MNEDNDEDLAEETHCECWYHREPCCNCGYDGEDELGCSGAGECAGQ